MLIFLYINIFGGKAMKRLLKTKDLQTVLYGIVRILKKNDEFSYKSYNKERKSILLLRSSALKNEMEVLRFIGKIKKELRETGEIYISINKSVVCRILKNKKNSYIIEDYSNKLLEFIIFELIECSKNIEIEYIRKSRPIPKEIYLYTLKMTYESEHIIDTDNLFERYSDISESIKLKIEKLLSEGEDCTINISSKLIKNKQYKFSFDVMFN